MGPVEQPGDSGLVDPHVVPLLVSMTMVGPDLLTRFIEER
jgi:hypothetical protein